VVRFGSDVPYLDKIGTTLLVGPGSILDAHTASEKVGKKALHDAVKLYVALAEEVADR
jgi:acetylornithine deacetylase/succinyl-diaminopimelate desuccinylase-like protein